MKKRLFALVSLLLVAAMTLSFAACGDAKKDDKKDDEETTATTTEKAEEPSDKPADESTDEPTEESADKSTDAPAQDAVSYPIVLDGVMVIEGVEVNCTLTFESDGTYAMHAGVASGDTFDYNGTYERVDTAIVLDGGDSGALMMDGDGYVLVKGTDEFRFSVTSVG